MAATALVSARRWPRSVERSALRAPSVSPCPPAGGLPRCLPTWLVRVAVTGRSAREPLSPHRPVTTAPSAMAQIPRQSWPPCISSDVASRSWWRHPAGRPVITRRRRRSGGRRHAGLCDRCYKRMRRSAAGPGTAPHPEGEGRQSETHGSRFRAARRRAAVASLRLWSTSGRRPQPRPGPRTRQREPHRSVSLAGPHVGEQPAQQEAVVLDRVRERGPLAGQPRPVRPRHPMLDGARPVVTLPRSRIWRTAAVCRVQAVFLAQTKNEM
jgi:hypothetical protein